MPDTGGETTHTLDRLGWDEGWDETYEAVAPPDAWPARLARADRGQSLVFGPDGPRLVASDSQRGQSSIAPATGDWVVVTEDPGLGPVIGAVLDRRTAITRRDPAERVIEQVLVANVDFVGLVVAVDQEVNAARLERFLVLAHDSGAEPVVVVTKADLDHDPVDVRARLEVASGATPILVTSAISGEGLAEVHDLIADDRTLVLLGESGSGKSRLVNALLDENRQEIGAVRDRDAKGRHTTTTRDLLAIPGGGVIIDTPGLRAVGIWDADDAVEVVFDDISELAAECRFRDCSHTVEPGCAVSEAVADGRVDPARLERYLALRSELDQQAQARTEQARRRPRRR